MTKKQSKPKPPKMAKGEPEQVRIRRDLGHEFALKVDEFGRTRLVEGTVEATRIYEVSNGGYISTGGIVRVRNVDPLVGISSLSKQQRDAGNRYREAFESSNREGFRTAELKEHVDGGRMTAGVPQRLAEAHAALAAAKIAIGHHEIVGVVDGVCGLGLPVAAIAKSTGDQRFTIVRLLKIGLDNLVKHYSGAKAA